MHPPMSLCKQYFISHTEATVTLPNKQNTWCVVFHAVLWAQAQLCVCTCVYARPCRVCMHTSQVLKLARKCCSATAKTDDTIKCIKRLLLLLVTQGPSGFGSLASCELSNCDPAFYFSYVTPCVQILLTCGFLNHFFIYGLFPWNFYGGGSVWITHKARSVAPLLAWVKLSWRILKNCSSTSIILFSVVDCLLKGVVIDLMFCIQYTIKHCQSWHWY